MKWRLKQKGSAAAVAGGTDVGTSSASDNTKDAKGGLGEFVSTIVWALGIAFVLRTFIFQPFTIPSASMYPGLMEGDYVITSKYSVGYGKLAAKPLPFPDVKGRLLGRGPERGDVIVFRPEGESENFIKRVVGLPGDRVQMREGRLYINEEPVSLETIGEEPYTHRQDGRAVADFVVERQLERLPGEDGDHFVYDGRKGDVLDNTGVFTVEPGKYFMMGDNRDFSGDSRASVGYVPAENIIGRAEFILLSVNEDFNLFNPLTWLNFRGDRFFKRVR